MPFITVLYRLALAFWVGPFALLCLLLRGRRLAKEFRGHHT